MKDVRAIVQEKLDLRGKHVIANNQVVQLPDDKPAEVNILTILNMLDAARMRYAEYARVSMDLERVLDDAMKEDVDDDQ